MPRFCHILKGEATEVADLCGMGCEKSGRLPPGFSHA